MKVASCNVVPGSRKAPLCRLKPNSRIGRVVSQVEAPFSWARSMDLCKEVGSDCFSLSASCLLWSHFSLRTSFLDLIWVSVISWESSRLCSMTAFLRGSVILVEAENSASAVDIGFVSAMPPSLAGRDKPEVSQVVTGG